MKAKRKLIYSLLLFCLSCILLISVTLGWFFANNIAEVNALTFFHPGITFQFQQSVDENNDGLPDTDANGIIYVNQEPENVRISSVYPGQTTAFRVIINTDTKLRRLNVDFKQISAPDGNNVDITKAMKVRYTNPVTEEPIDASLFSLLDVNREVNLFSGYELDLNSVYTFDYSVYMSPDAGNEYQGMELAIGKIVFYVSQ